MTCTQGVAARRSNAVGATRTHAVRQVVSPRITKVEPPNWWVGFRGQIELLLTGENLEGAKVATSYSGLSIARSKATTGGRYLLCWVTMAPDTQPGDATLRVQTPSGETSITWPLARRGSSAGKFQGFSDDDVIYLIMVDRFADGDRSNDELADAPSTYDRSNPHAYHGGDLRGIRDHLDYLHRFGVTTLWLTPIVENDPRSAQDYHGYGAVDEYAVEEHFGTLKDLQELVNAAHSERMKVILDFVPNHVGPRHPWNDAPPEPDWFHGTKEHHLTSNGNFQFLADPHAPPRYSREVVDGWFAGILPDLNQDNPDVADYFVENALWWAEETGIDGYRLDTFPYVSRRFWAQWHHALHEAYPRMTTVGEVFNPDPTITSFFAGGRVQFDGIDSGLTTVFDYPLFQALRDVISGGAPVANIVKVLSQDRLYPHPQLLVPFEGNHDVIRLASLPGMSIEKQKLAFSVLLTARGIPEIYYGDEIGMMGGDDPDNRHDFPGGFPGDAQNAFIESGRTPQQQEIFSHVQRLLALRRDHEALRRGKLWNIFWDQTAYAFARTSEGERLLIVVNTSAHTQRMQLSFSDTALAGGRRLLPLLNGSAEDVHNDETQVAVPGEQVQVYSVQ
jgi:neopullulanase